MLSSIKILGNIKIVLLVLDLNLVRWTFSLSNSNILVKRIIFGEDNTLSILTDNRKKRRSNPCIRFNW